MKSEFLLACILVILGSQFCLAQVPAEVWFVNGTGVPLTIRCFSKKLNLEGFSVQVNPKESVATADLAPGDRVIGVWTSDQVTSIVRRFRPGSVSKITLEMRNGKLGVLPSTVQQPIGQQAEPSLSHFHSKEWQTLCSASDGRSYPVSVDFQKGAYTTQSYVGQFSNMVIRETNGEWKIAGRWNSPTQAGNVSFTVSKQNLNQLLGLYTIDGNPTAYDWRSR